MTRLPIPLSIPDLSAFARQLAGALRTSGPVRHGHVEWLNHLARAAGFRNFQHLRAASTAQVRLDAPDAPPPLLDHAQVEKTLRHFDAGGRLARWPARRSQQILALWALWSLLPARTVLHERTLSALLGPLHGFADAALLRRDMVGLGLLSRTADGTVYRRCEAAPPPEARDLIRRLSARRRTPAG